MAKSAQADLSELLDRSAESLVSALLDLAQARYEGVDPQPALSRIARLVAGSQALADLFGRRRVYLISRGANFAAADTAVPIVPDVPFLEAVDSMLDRQPMLRRGWLEVSRAYTLEYGFVVAKSIDVKVTQQVQRAISASVLDGLDAAQGTDVLRRMTGWTRAYAETVWRTNVASAYEAGMWRQAADPDLAEVVGGFRFSAVHDRDVRPQHAKLDGLTAASSDPIWDRVAPPRGYNCRCTLEPVSREELERAGVIRDGRVINQRLPPGWEPDRGFDVAVRPDRRFYGGR
jgi:SPP1 gp7 family putative phage head morphogenesis protein